MLMISTFTAVSKLKLSVKLFFISVMPLVDIVR